MAHQPVAGEQVERGRLDRGGLVAAAALSVILGTLGWVRHRNYWTGAFDLGIFDQAVWQLAHGRAFTSILDRNIFADHFSLVLLLFVPLYWIAATPVWLLWGQAVALGATVLPLRAMAKDAGVPTWVATALVACSAPLLAAATFDFHPATLAVPFVAATLLYARRDERRRAVAFAAAIVLCRADLGLVIVAVAIVSGRRTRLPLAAVGVGAAIAGALVPGLFGETNGWAPHFGHLGSGPVDAALHPWHIVAALASEGSLRPLVTWVLAAGGLVLLQRRWMLALVVAGLPVLLSRWGATELPWFHYGAPMAPIAIGGTLFALSPDRPPWRMLGTFRSGIVVGSVSVAVVFASPLSALAPDQFRAWEVLHPAPGARAVAAAEIATDEVVSADNRIVPHLAHREQIYLYPVPFAIPEGFFAEGAEPDLSKYPPGLVDVVIAPAGLVPAHLTERYRVVDRVQGFVILRRR